MLNNAIIIITYFIAGLLGIGLGLLVWKCLIAPMSFINTHFLLPPDENKESDEDSDLAERETILES